MSSNATEQRLIRVIAEHYLEGGSGRLSIGAASERAGITRQAFNRGYKHLKLYVQGKRSVDELITGGTEEARGLLAKFQARVRELQRELDDINARHSKSIEEIRDSHITTLMCTDLSLKNADAIREMLEKSALHNEILVKENQRLRLEVSAAQAREMDLKASRKKYAEASQEHISIEPDLEHVFRNFLIHKDLAVFEAQKDAEVDGLLKKINALSRTGETLVVLFLDLYLSSFSKYVDRFSTSFGGKVLLVRVPIFSRAELKIFAAKIVSANSIEIHVPFCANESIRKAQRKFLFRDVLEIELQAADKMQPPQMQHGYGKVVVFQVLQGD